MAPQLDLNETGKALFQKAATELQAEMLVELAKCGSHLRCAPVTYVMCRTQRDGSVYITMVQLLLAEAGSPWPSLTDPLPATPVKRVDHTIDFTVPEPTVLPSEMPDGDAAIAPIPVPGGAALRAEKPATFPAARTALRAALQSPNVSLPFTQGDVLAPNVAPLFTAYHGPSHSVAPHRKHASHQHALYYAAAWSSWQCQLCSTSITRQVRTHRHRHTHTRTHVQHVSAVHTQVSAHSEPGLVLWRVLLCSVHGLH